jgi:hypothetical protein
MCERDICAAAHKRMQNSLFRALRHTADPSHGPRQIGGSLRALGADQLRFVIG